MGQGFFESDDDYRARVTQEANEKTIESATGSAPTQGIFESEDDYRSRVSLEANEAILEQSTGEPPSQGIFESDSDYRSRISLEANEHVIEEGTGESPTQGFFESDESYRSRIRQEAHEQTIEGATGSSPSQGLFESEGEYRRRITLEAREFRANPPKNSESQQETSNSGGRSTRSAEQDGAGPSGKESGGFGALLFLALVILGGIGYWTTTQSSASKLRQGPSKPKPNTPTPWSDARAFIRSAGGRSLALSPKFELAVDGVAVSSPLKYAERDTPKAGAVSELSNSARYAFVSLCDDDWCDDTRLIDFRQGLIATLRGDKASAPGFSGASWSPNDEYALLPWAHGGESGFFLLDPLNLQYWEPPTTLTSLLVNPDEWMLGPDQNHPSSPHPVAIWENVRWLGQGGVQFVADVMGTQWESAAENGQMIGVPVVIGRIGGTFTIPGLRATLRKRWLTRNVPNEENGKTKIFYWSETGDPTSLVTPPQIDTSMLVEPWLGSKVIFDLEISPDGLPHNLRMIQGPRNDLGRKIEEAIQAARFRVFDDAAEVPATLIMELSIETSHPTPPSEHPTDEL